jgi:PRTRC genetic system protein A
MIPPLKLVEHLLMEQPTLPLIRLPRAYIVAQNGVFVWARRAGLEALIPVASCTIRGLYPVEPYVRMSHPPVDTWLTASMLRLSREARTLEGGFLEILFYLTWERKHGWHLTVPAQEQEALRVHPILDEVGQALYAETLIEVHSHHTMRAFFSSTDDKDEQGFRIYGVIGCVDNQRDHPTEMRLRVGIYGHFWELPASQVLSMPWGVRDCGGHA